MFEQVQAIVGPYQSIAVVCERYDARAAEVARLMAELVSQYMPGVFVEHIGSTAVPGCKGQGIVDLMIAGGEGQLETIGELLDRLGFEQQTGPDPLPEDRPIRAGTLSHNKHTFPLHVHVIPLSSPEVARMRKFRDWLRADPDLVAAYVACKKKIISKGIGGSRDYCEAKRKFIEEVLECL